MSLRRILNSECVAFRRAELLFRLVLLTAVAALVSCDNSVRKRPYGDLRIGLYSELSAPESYLPKMRLMVRHDAGGFSVMSTLCTHDLTPLVLKNGPDGRRIFVSNYSESQYLDDGTVIHGPAVGNLPYYKAVIAEDVRGGTVNTLYVTIGEEVPPSWRLPDPAPRPAPPSAPPAAP